MSVILLVFIACLVMIGAALTVAAMQVATKSYVAGVSDLAALAAAHQGSCQGAEEVIERNQRPLLTLIRCETEGGYAQVLVRAERSGLEAISRAGPAW